MAGALEQAYTTQAGAALIVIELKSGRIEHQSPSFLEGRTAARFRRYQPGKVGTGGGARLHPGAPRASGTGGEFHSLCQSVARDAGEPYGKTFRELEKVLESFTVHSFTGAPGPPGLRNPEWLRMVRAVTLTLVGVQLAGESPAAGRRLPTSWQGQILEAVGVFTVDLSGGAPQQWTLQVAHARYLMELEVAKPPQPP